MVDNFFQKSKSSFCLDRVICRIVAAFSVFWAWGLLSEKGFDQLAYRQHMQMGRIFLLVALIFFVFSCAHIVFQKYETDSWFLLSGATVCVVRWLTLSSEFLFVLAVTLVYCLFILYFVQRNESLWEERDPGKKTFWCVGIVCGLICGGVISVITCLRYMTFSSPNFDFGIFVNMLHHMKECGAPLCSTERDVMMSHFAVHLSPIWYVLLPFYAIFPSPLTLQIGQAVAVASGVIPVILLCRCRKLSGKSTILATVIYCFYPALTTSCFFDIHENCFLAPLLLWTFYFFEREKYISMYIFSVLTLFVKEDAAVYIFLFALYVLLEGKKRRHGIFLAVGALAYFCIATEILERLSLYYAEFYADESPNPEISGPMINRYDSLIYDPKDGLFGALKTLLLNPGYLLKQLFFTAGGGWEKLQYFFYMLLPVGFLPFFAKKFSRWILLTPILLNLLTDYLYQYNMNYQYHFGISAFLIYVSILNLSDMKGNLGRNVVSVAAAACCCLCLTSVYPKISASVRNWNENREEYLRMEEILETVPEDASVCCSTFLVAHLADRDEVYDMDYHKGEGNVDYVIFDARSSISNRDLHIFLRQGYVVKEEYENLLLILVKEGK